MMATNVWPSFNRYLIRVLYRRLKDRVEHNYYTAA